MRLQPRALIVLAALASGCPRHSVPNDQPKDCSIVGLIASPRDYDGARVRVVAFFSSDPEGTALYLSESDLRFAITNNGIWLELDEVRVHAPETRALSGKPVLVVGKFVKDGKGHMGLYSGSIADVERLEEWAVRE